MLTVGEDLDDSVRAAAVAQRYGLYAAAGIHPHQARDAPSEMARRLCEILANQRVVAIGETGLDYYYDNSPREAQARVLREQLAVARETRYPVVFHQRDAFADFTTILREEWRPEMRGVVHCFTGTQSEARTYVDEFGLLLGVGGVLTFPNSNGLREAVRAVGLDHIVLETDCPYLAPVPMRGRRNEPAFVAHTAEKLSELLGCTLADVAAVTDRNALTLLGI